MVNIINSFANKNEIDNIGLNNLFFVYNGQGGEKFDKNLTFNEMASSIDKK